MDDLTRDINHLKQKAMDGGPELSEDLSRARHEILKIMDKHPTGQAAVCMIVLELIRENRSKA